MAKGISNSVKLLPRPPVKEAADWGGVHAGSGWFTVPQTSRTGPAILSVVSSGYLIFGIFGLVFNSVCSQILVKGSY